MIVVDSSALVAVLRREAEADDFLRIIAANAGGCLLSSGACSRPAWCWPGALAQVAREAFLRFGKGRHPAALNLGDCATYALATTQDLPLLFKGANFSQTDLISAALA